MLQWFLGRATYAQKPTQIDSNYACERSRLPKPNDSQWLFLRIAQDFSNVHSTLCSQHQHHLLPELIWASRGDICLGILYFFWGKFSYFELILQLLESVTRTQEKTELSKKTDVRKSNMRKLILPHPHQSVTFVKIWTQMNIRIYSYKEIWHKRMPE